jgi:hypothetical protein
MHARALLTLLFRHFAIFYPVDVWNSLWLLSSTRDRTVLFGNRVVHSFRQPVESWQTKQFSATILTPPNGFHQTAFSSPFRDDERAERLASAITHP